MLVASGKTDARAALGKSLVLVLYTIDTILSGVIFGDLGWGTIWCNVSGFRFLSTSYQSVSGGGGLRGESD